MAAEPAWILYDGSCGVCRRLVERWRPALERRRFKLAPLQEPWVGERLSLPAEELMEEMRVLLPGGRLLGGADALLAIGRRFWWALPLVALGRLPPFRWLLDRAYRSFAARRHRMPCARP